MPKQICYYSSTNTSLLLKPILDQQWDRLTQGSAQGSDVTLNFFCDIPYTDFLRVCQRALVQWDQSKLSWGSEVKGWNRLSLKVSWASSQSKIITETDFERAVCLILTDLFGKDVTLVNVV